MRRGKNTAEILDDYELDDIDLSGEEYQERTLVLKAAPPSRREQLLAHGVVEIRCICCGHVKPLAGAEDAKEGWVCEDCVREPIEEQRMADQGGRH